MLASLGPVRRVDRLSSDQPPLRFATNGVTLVYGANASGKSGYCRIAKILCRSLNSIELRSNVYESLDPRPPEVTVAFRVGDDDEDKQELTWYTDQVPPSELSRISVFDSETARVYVDKERKIEFLPYELDLMNKLGLACRALDEDFRNRIDAVDAGIDVRLPEGYHEGTVVQKALACLTPQTPPNELPTEEYLRNLGSWTAKKQADINAVRKQLSQDPKVMIRLLSEARRALETVREEVSVIENNLADPPLASFHRKQKDAEIASQAAEAAAKDLFSGQPIPDLGSETWRQMLIHARDFAVTAFRDVPPPQLARVGLCVLCQQVLDEYATTRMAAFDDYIVGRASEESVAATRAFDTHRNKLMTLRVKPIREVETLLSGYAALSDASQQNGVTIAAFVKGARERLDALKGALRANRYDSLQLLDQLPASPTSLIEKEIVRLNTEIAELESAERNEEVLSSLQARHHEYADEKRLSEQIEIIVERRKRLVERYRLGECIRQCRSTAVTRRITDRRREILTPTLKTFLDGELKKLQLTHIPLNLTDRGQDAESIIEISLNAKQRVANNSDVLSEGEQRALALACFLAELREIGGDHAVIFDDPVSSLDHGRMEAVAKRLAEEALNGRQVIVFTHNILFHHMLWTEARRALVGRHREWMSSTGNDLFGLIDEKQKPRQLKRVRERLHEIQQEFAGLIASGYDQADQMYRPAVVGLYTYMRETWERVVEEILLNNVVQRFRPEIMTQRLEQAYVDPNSDYPAIFEGMKRCSHYSGHDPAPDLPPRLPDPEEIEQDITDLTDFANTAINRLKSLRKSPPYEEGVEAILL